MDKDPKAGVGVSVDPEWCGGSVASATRELAGDQARAGVRAGPQECPASGSWGPRGGEVPAPVRGRGARSRWEVTEEVTGRGWSGGQGAGFSGRRLGPQPSGGDEARQESTPEWTAEETGSGRGAWLDVGVRGRGQLPDSGCGRRSGEGRGLVQGGVLNAGKTTSAVASVLRGQGRREADKHASFQGSIIEAAFSVKL